MAHEASTVTLAKKIQARMDSELESLPKRLAQEFNLQLAHGIQHWSGDFLSIYVGPKGEILTVDDQGIWEQGDRSVAPIGKLSTLLADLGYRDVQHD